MHDSSSTWKSSKVKGQTRVTMEMKQASMLDQFNVGFHPYKVDIIDAKFDDHCSCHLIVQFFSMGEKSWPLVWMTYLKKLESGVMSMVDYLEVMNK